MFLKILGIIDAALQLGQGGPKIKNASGAIEARNAGDSAYAVLRGASPVGDDDLVTKAWALANVQETGAVRCIRFTVGTANASSTKQLPDNARVQKVRVDVTTAYSAGGSLDIGVSGTASKFVATADINEQATGAYVQDMDVLQTPAAAVLATVGGTPAAGAAAISVWYSNPDV